MTLRGPHSDAARYRRAQRGAAGHRAGRPEMRRARSAGRPDGRLVEACLAVHERLNAPLATMVGLDDRARFRAYWLAYVFAATAGWASRRPSMDPAELPIRHARSLPAAHWYEREVRDLLGLTPGGHPGPAPGWCCTNWPAGVYPLGRISTRPRRRR
ncbi:MAG: NADH-quinone oxidoreductase subunit C [Chloroflexota bacterium]